jgi:hypothetical protein
MDAGEPSFLVQALDNAGENLVDVAPSIAPRDSGIRYASQRLREAVNEVGLQSREIQLTTAPARLRQRDGAFNLEIDLARRDAAGRIVTVLCHAQSPVAVEEAWVEAMAVRLSSFLGRHGLPEPADGRAIFREVAERVRRPRNKRALNAIWNEIKENAVSREFPEDPRQRRLLVFVDEGRRAALEMSRDGQHLLRDRSAQVLEYPLSPDLLEGSDVLDAIERRGDADVGVVLALNPLAQDHYVRLDALSGEIALKKIRLTTELCRRLGATRVHVDEVVAESQNGSSRWSAAASQTGVSGSLEWLNTELANVMRSVNVHDEFAGGEASIPDAWKLIEQHGLQHDGSLTELIDLRTGSNPLRRRVIEIVTRHEIAATQEIAVKAHAALTNLGLDRARSQDELRTYVFKLTIEFPST